MTAAPHLVTYRASRIAVSSLLLPATLTQLPISALALSLLRETAFRRSRAMSSALSCVAGGAGVRRSRPPIDNSIPENPIVTAGNRPSRQKILSAALFSSTIRHESGDVFTSIEPNALSPDTNQRRQETSWSNYERLVRKLYMTNLFNPVKLGLENMFRLHKALGCPMDKHDVSIVHIAGSNGKGSVALKIANTLQLAGYKVGLFVSPHISSFRERIQINGKPISEIQVEKYLQDIYNICETEDIPATFFEITTALAFQSFAREGTEAVVLETGLGGRLDATNVVRSPALSIITSIGLEHTRILGDTVEKIALEKGGIIKEGCPVLVGRDVPVDVLRECAEEKRASVFYQCKDVLGNKAEDPIDILENEEVFKDYDIENSRTASVALNLLQFHLTEKKNKHGGDFNVKLTTADQIQEGIKIRPPCRFEEMDIHTKIASDDGTATKKIVRVVLDVAHNPQAVDYLLCKLRLTYPNISPSNQRIVLGMSADKDLRRITKKLLNHIGRVENLHLVEATHPRAAPVSSILEANPELFGSHYDAPQNENARDISCVSRQVRRALALAARNGELLVICGSLFIMADAREELGIIEPRDSEVIAEVAGAGLRNSQENFGEGGNKK